MSADAWGIDAGYHDIAGVWHSISSETRAALMAAMGASGDAPGGEFAPTVLFATQGCPTRLPSVGELILEDGGRLPGQQDAPADLPLGYHQFQPDSDDLPLRLIVSPPRCKLPPRATWGWAAQLYAMRSEMSWGLGDLADLARLGRWSRKQGAGLLLLNPLSAVAPVVPQQPSPYYPASRCFQNPLYICVPQVPGAAATDLEDLAVAGRLLNSSDRIDRDAAFTLKQLAFERIWRSATPGEPFERFCREQGVELHLFAVFSALAEQHGGDWRCWPAELKNSREPAVARFAGEHADRIRYHKWLQWILDEQLAQAAAEIPLVQDLPIGVDPAGADAWRWQHILAQGCTVGAPPDPYSAQGQDWGLPPFVPHKLRAAGYEPFIQTIRSALRRAGGLRIDHVMGLFRLFWIPAGHSPAQGAFVRYAVDELLDIVALESHRAGAYIVGEDLGTVEAGVRERLAQRGVLSYRVLLFEDRPAGFPELAMAAATTHDLPTIAGAWTGHDLRAQQAAGLKPDVGSAHALRDRLRGAIGLTDEAGAEQAVEATYERLAQAPSLLLTATLEDALAVQDRPNMPGTIHEWPNWSLPLPGGLEALERSALAERIAARLRRGDPPA